MIKLSSKIEARKLRRRGNSIESIANELSVSKSTASRWCRGVKLSKKQTQKLFIKKIKGLIQGRKRGILVKKYNRLNKIKNYKIEGEKRFNELSNQEIFIAGLFMYLAGGSKKRISFTSSDPVILKFMVKWFETFFKVPPERFVFKIFSRKSKIKTAKRFWAKEIDFPFKRFKVLRSKEDRLAFRISGSADLFYKILGLAYGFFKRYKLSRA